VFGEGEFLGGIEIVRTVGCNPFADPGAGGLFEIGPGFEPETHDRSAGGRYVVDRPWRRFGHHEIASSAERQPDTAAGDSLSGVRPKVCEELGPVPRTAENVAIGGR
jgi:hypothetical protein